MMSRWLCCSCVLVSVMGLQGPRAQAAEKFSALHEVIRHFEVAFVERANLDALLLGGLQGIKNLAPGAKIEVLAQPALFSIGNKKGKTVSISGGASLGYKQLEDGLRRSMELALEQGWVKDARALEHAVIRGMVTFCGDPWSIFLEGDLYNRLLDDGKTPMGEAGLLVEHDGGGLKVLDAIADSSAHQAGIRPGMKIDRIGNKPATSLNELEALALLRGKIGDKVEVALEGKPYSLSFAPEPKKNIAVDTLPNGIARVHLLNFRDGTGKRLADVLGKIESSTKEKLKGLVLDLRGNPGGLVTEASEVAGLFINGGKVVSVKSQKQMREEVETSRAPGSWRNLPLVVLVDHRTASVSEIVCMALRDYKRAKLVGEKTLGKGTVQVVMELMDGSALKLSTGRYYSPNSIPLYEGLEPDVEIIWNGQGEDVQLKKAIAALGG